MQHRVWLDMKLPSLNVTHGMHWSKYNRQKQDWRHQVQIAVKKARIPRLKGPLALTVRVFLKKKSGWDCDNRSVKPLLDGLTDEYVVIGGKRILSSRGIIEDDDISVIRSVKVVGMPGAEVEGTELIIEDFCDGPLAPAGEFVM